MWELPFWLSLLFWSLLPAAQTPWLEIESIPINSKDAVLVSVTAFYLLLSLYRRPISISPKNWHYHLPIFMPILLCYAGMTVNWSGMDTDDATAMRYTLLLTASSFALGYSLIVQRSYKSLQHFLWRLTVYLAFLGLLYSAESFFSLGLRSETTKKWTDFGIQRVRGPLFGSSTGYFILIPAISFAAQELIRTHKRRLFKSFILLSLMLTLISLGARAGLLTLFVFFLSTSFFLKSGNRNKVVLSLIVVITISALIMFSKVKVNRLHSFEDTARYSTHLTSWQIITNRSSELNIFGSGYGSYWPWYLPDVEDGGAHATGRYFDLTWNPFGHLLYHPHSTLLLLVVELGAAGVLYFFTLWRVLVLNLFHSLKSGSYTIFSCGVFASGFSMFFDFFLFKGSQLNAIWWIFCFSALALNYQVEKPKENSTSANISTRSQDVTKQSSVEL